MPPPPLPQKTPKKSNSYSREVSPSTQRTMDNSQFTLENKSDNSSNPSSPEFPATKNRWLWCFRGWIVIGMSITQKQKYIWMLFTVKRFSARLSVHAWEIWQWPQKHCVCSLAMCCRAASIPEAQDISRSSSNASSFASVVEENEGEEEYDTGQVGVDPCLFTSRCKTRPFDFLESQITR